MRIKKLTLKNLLNGKFHTYIKIREDRMMNPSDPPPKRQHLLAFGQFRLIVGGL